MTTLFDYQKQTQRFLRDGKQDLLNPEDLVVYINRARRQVAGDAQLIRILTPVSGSIIGWTVTNPGSGYSLNPTLAITPPDFPSGTLPKPNGDQAIATAVIQNGQIAQIESTYGGYGYWEPRMTITDSTGTGATAIPVMSFINQLSLGQEVYPVSNVDLSMFPGVGSIYFIRSLSVIYQNYRYSLPVYSFSEYQAMIRQYPFQYQYVPTFAAQFGQGTNLSFYAYPLPSQQYQWEFDALCLPQDLMDDQDYEALPGPWTDAVPYFAAHLAYLELQNFNAAKGYLDLYEKMLQKYSNNARIGRRVNPYGRY